MPARCADIQTFKPSSTVVENKYSLKMYERTVQVGDSRVCFFILFFLRTVQVCGQAIQMEGRYVNELFK